MTENRHRINFFRIHRLIVLLLSIPALLIHSLLAVSPFHRSSDSVLCLGMCPSFTFAIKIHGSGLWMHFNCFETFIIPKRINMNPSTAKWTIYVNKWFQSSGFIFHLLFFVCSFAFFPVSLRYLSLLLLFFISAHFLSSLCSFFHFIFHKRTKASCNQQSDDHISIFNMTVCVRIAREKMGIHMTRSKFRSNAKDVLPSHACVSVYMWPALLVSI